MNTHMYVGKMMFQVKIVRCDWKPYKCHVAMSRMRHVHAKLGLPVETALICIHKCV